AAGGALVTVSDTLRLIDIFAGMETWQIGFIVTGAPGLVLAFAVFALPEPVRRGSRRTQDIGSWRDVLGFLSAHRRFFAGHLTGFSILMVITYGLSAWLPVLLMRSFGWEAGQVGVVYALFILCNSLLALTVHGLI